MKSMRFFSIVIVLALLVSVVPVVSAAGPTGTWVSGIACQNLDNANDASGTLSFYAQGSTTTTLDYPLAITKGTSKNYYTPNLSGLGTNFLGSVVVNSSTQLACSVNTEAGSGTVTSPYRKGTSSGLSADDTGLTAYVPQVLKSFGTAPTSWNSYIAIQNTGSGDVNVEVSYRTRSGTLIDAATETYTIGAYTNKVVYQSDNANLPTGFLGSAIVKNVSASAPANTYEIAVVVNMYNSGTDNTTAQFQSYNAFPAGSNTLMVPRIIRRYYGFNGGMSIQNTSATTSTYVKIDFTFNGTTYTYQSGEIKPLAALALYAPNIAELSAVDALSMSKRSGSAKITTTDAGGTFDAAGSIVAIINEDNRGLASDNNGAAIPVEQIGQGITYNAVLSGAETTSVFIPQFVRNASVFNGGFQIANTTGSAGTCDITYNSDTDANETGKTLAANGVIVRYGPNVTNLNNGYNASVTVTCTVPIIGMYNFSASSGTGKLGDSLITNNTINQ